MAEHLATEYFFGEAVMGLSTPTGADNTDKLNKEILDKIRRLPKNSRKRTNLCYEVDARLQFNRSVGI